MDRFQIDHRAIDELSPSRTRMVIEGKSVPIATRRRLRPRFGYLVALFLICTGALLIPAQVVLATIAFTTMFSLAMVGLAFIVQMPVPFLQSKLHLTRHLPTSKQAKL